VEHSAPISRSGRGEATGQQADLGDIRPSGGEVDNEVAGLFDDPGAELCETLSQGCELGLGQWDGGRDGLAQRQLQPVGGAVQDQTHLVDDPALTGGAIGDWLHPVRSDQVLGLAAAAVTVFPWWLDLTPLTGPRFSVGDFRLLEPLREGISKCRGSGLG
jgi:hypothetical protein